MKVWREVNQKPPLGAVVDPEHWRNRELVNRWLFNEGAGAYLHSLTDQNSGTMPTGAKWSHAGLVVADSGATTHVDCGTSYRPANAVTMIARVYMTTLSTATLLANRDGERNTVGYEFRVGRTYLDTGTDIVHFATRVGADWHIWDTRDVASGFTQNQWHTVAISYLYGSGASAAAYMDAVPVAGAWRLGNGNSSPAFTTHPVWIGYYSGAINAKFRFKGTIEHMTLYASALTADQIREIYEKPYGGLLVPGFARIFDMGGVPIGAIRTRFPALTGGLRI